MNKAIEIRLDRDTANDEEATVVKIFVASGTAVRADDPVFDVENSKATQEIVAPGDGILVHALSVGDTLPFGEAVALIVPPGTNDLTFPKVVRKAPAMATAAVVPAQLPEPVEGRAPRSDHKPRFSQAARQSLAKYGLDEREFSLPFVTSRQIEARLKPNKSGARPSVPAAAAGVLPRKRDEIKSLSSGAGNTMLSVLGIEIGSIEAIRSPGDFFAGKIIDLLVFEASRLMRKYPKLNAAYRDGTVELHPVVNAGLAFDEGARLVVYGIENADKKDLLALRAEIEDALARYVERKLTAQEMMRATFTITDLSALDLGFVFPILPEGQSTIIAVTRDTVGKYSLYAGFDHRVTEGLEVAKFLNELRDRLRSFGETVLSGPRCSFCDKSADEETSAFRGRGLIRVVNAKGDDVLSCYACWSGW
jgi:pyruvate/2-oxoglutarate dehydrogenase complex dihydrolipoamide acyltransferase (E2) component